MLIETTNALLSLVAYQNVLDFDFGAGGSGGGGRQAPKFS